MVTISIHAKINANVYNLLISKQRELAKNSRGMFEEYSHYKKRNTIIWRHKYHDGRVEFIKGINGSIVASIKTKDEQSEWMLMDSFISFFVRHFKPSVSGFQITF